MKTWMMTMTLLIVATIAWAANANCPQAIAASFEINACGKSERLGASRASDAGGICCISSWVDSRQWTGRSDCGIRNSDGGALGAAATFSATEGGTIDMASPASGNGYSFANNVVTINQSGSYTITGTTTSNRVAIATGVTATITLQNASITSAVASPFALSPDGCDVTVRLVGSNVLASTVSNSQTPGVVYGAGMQVEGGASVTIEGTGSLTATGSACSSGIGSGHVENAGANSTGRITINSGTITAQGTYGGAGIGGGIYSPTGTIVINGGTIAATSGIQAAGIGAGAIGGNSGSIIINGGTITATGVEGGAGIGGGKNSPGGSITIYGGTITANGGYQAPGIGSGTQSNGGVITINGGDVTANGGSEGAGIGSGREGPGGIIVINGGFVKAHNGDWGAGIGSGALAAGGDIFITGGVVMAFGGGNGDPPGIGGGGNNGTVTISGGTVYAYSTTGVGIGRGSTGTIEISGGTVIAKSVGSWSGGGILTTIHGKHTAVVASDISDKLNLFDSATVHRGVSITTTASGLQVTFTSPLYLPEGAELVVPANLVNFDYAHFSSSAQQRYTFDYDSLHINPDPIHVTDTTDTLVHDTLIRQVRDTLVVHLPDTTITTLIHDSFRTIVPAERDTIYVNRQVIVFDTIFDIRRDTIHDSLPRTIEHRYTFYDTLRFLEHDTLWEEITEYDTVMITLIVHDTLHLQEILTFYYGIPEVTYRHVTDTIWNDIKVYKPFFVPIYRDDETGAEVLPLLLPEARAVAIAGGVLIQGLTPDEPFTIHTLDGRLVLRATAPADGIYLLRSLASGAYLLGQGGRWWKFGR